MSLAEAARQCIDEPGRAPDVVRLLADQVGRTMATGMTRRLALLTSVILAGTAVALGAAALGREQKEPPPAEKPRPAEKPAPASSDPGWHLILEKSDRRIAVRLTDGNERDVSLRGGEVSPSPDAARVTVSHTASPDGKRVVYQVTQPGLHRRNGIIAVADADGTHLRDLTAGTQSYYPAWSPDGKRIVFLSDRSSEWHLYSIAADAAKDDAEHVSREPVPADCHPCFAADGRLIHTIARGGLRKLPLMDLVTWDGQVEKKLVEKNYVLTFSVSPDGSKLAYVLPTELAVHDLTTGVERRWPMKDVDASWRVTVFQVLWRPDSGALGLSFAFLGDLQEGARVAGDDYVAVLSLKGARPELRTYRVGINCRLFAWATEADLKRKK
jgi:hypothetical protein